MQGLKAMEKVSELLLGGNVLGTAVTCLLSFGVDVRTGDDSAGNLAQLIKTNTTLKYLNIEMNLITDAGAKHITDALPENKTLVAVDMSWNRIGILVVLTLD
jgi:Ran GTPase-activating protein (RanGAP) involved in mRNA processing and transport